MPKLFPVILSGGSGTRLWPLSRQSRPKQFLPLIGEQSLFQDTLTRLESIECEAPIVVCNESHRFLIAEQAKEINQLLTAIILEPSAKNTAPAIALATFYLSANGHGDDVMMVMPSDHVIQNQSRFNEAVQIALDNSLKEKLVTFGIVPTHPETGYGYIKAPNLSGNDAYPVESFVEKPSLEVAQQYLAIGNYYWNSGMFMFKVSTFLDELKVYEPEMFRHCEDAVNLAKNDLDFCRVDFTAFEQCPSNSIDYAVMEKTKNAVLVPLDVGWSDVGAWPAVWDIQNKDGDGNVGRGDFMALQSQDNYVHSEHRLVTLLGVHDLMVVETSDAVLVASKDKAQEVKSIVSTLTKHNRPEAFVHRVDYRPWGQFDLIDSGEHFQVKRITMKPHEKLSLQLHHHRAEHWVIVSGIAKVQIGDEVRTLKENQSVYIPMGTKHSLENPSESPLELIEVQTGSYLGEDDIVRFEDRYGRN